MAVAATVRRRSSGPRHRRGRFRPVAPGRRPASPGAARLSRWTTSSPARKDNVAHLAGNARFTLVEADVSRACRPDHPAAGRAVRRDPALGLAGQPHRLRPAPGRDPAGRLGGHPAPAGPGGRRPARFLMASTSEAYGDPQVHPQPETYWGNVNPIGVRSVYDEAKRFSEAATMAYHRYRGLDVGDRPDLQHVRPADAPGRRPGHPHLHLPGAARRADHRARHRRPDPLDLLRRRPGPGHPAAARLRPRPARSTAAPSTRCRCGTGRDDRVADRQQLRGDVTSPAAPTTRRCAAPT